jgi:hypothetical protein
MMANNSDIRSNPEYAGYDAEIASANGFGQFCRTESFDSLSSASFSQSQSTDSTSTINSLDGQTPIDSLLNDLDFDINDNGEVGHENLEWSIDVFGKGKTYNCCKKKDCSCRTRKKNGRLNKAFSYGSYGSFCSINRTNSCESINSNNGISKSPSFTNLSGRITPDINACPSPCMSNFSRPAPSPLPGKGVTPRQDSISSFGSMGTRQDSTSSIGSVGTDDGDWYIFNTKTKDNNKENKVMVCNDKKEIIKVLDTTSEDKTKAVYVGCSKPHHKKKPCPRKMGHIGHLTDKDGRVIMGNSRGLDFNNNQQKKRKELYCSACAETERLSDDKSIVYCCESWDISSSHFFQHPYLEGTSDKKSSFQCTNCVLLSKPTESMTCRKVFKNKKYNKCFLNSKDCKCDRKETPENFFRKFLRVGILNPKFGNKHMRIGKGEQGSECLPLIDDEYVIERKDFLAIVFERLKEVIKNNNEQLTSIVEKSNLITQNYGLEGAKDQVFVNFEAMLGIWCQKGWRKGKLRSSWRLFPNGNNKSLLRENLVKELFYMTKHCNRKYCLFGCRCRYGVHQNAYRDLVFGKNGKSGIWNPNENCYSVRKILSDEDSVNIIENFAQEWIENYESKTPSFICLDQICLDHNVDVKSEAIKKKIQNHLQDAIRAFNCYNTRRDREFHEMKNSSRKYLESALNLYTGNPLKNMTKVNNWNKDKLQTLKNLNIDGFSITVEGDPELLKDSSSVKKYPKTPGTRRTYRPFETIHENESSGSSNESLKQLLDCYNKSTDNLSEQKDNSPVPIKKPQDDFSDIWKISQNSKDCIIM